MLVMRFCNVPLSTGGRNPDQKYVVAGFSFGKIDNLLQKMENGKQLVSDSWLMLESFSSPRVSGMMA